MACEQEFATMTNAILALDTSVLAMEQAAAIVNSNMVAAQAAIMAYQICMSQQGGMQPMTAKERMLRTRKTPESLFHNLKMGMLSVMKWISTVKNECAEIVKFTKAM